MIQLAVRQGDERARVAKSGGRLLRGKYPCWKCKQEIEAVKLGAMFYQESYFENADMPQWERREGPIWEQEDWCNCCIHCGAVQEEDGDWRYAGWGPVRFSRRL